MSNKGFTLIEMMVSILILGIVVIGVFPLFSQAFNSIFSAGDKVQQVHGVKTQLLDKLSDQRNTSPASIVVNFEDADNAGNDFSLPAKKFNADGTYKLPGGKDKDIKLEYYILDY